MAVKEKIISGEMVAKKLGKYGDLVNRVPYNADCLFTQLWVPLEELSTCGKVLTMEEHKKNATHYIVSAVVKS